MPIFNMVNYGGGSLPEGIISVSGKATVFYNGSNNGIDIPLGNITYPLALFLTRDESSPSPKKENLIKYIGIVDDMSVFNASTGKITQSSEEQNLLSDTSVFSMWDYRDTHGGSAGFYRSYFYNKDFKYLEFARKDNNTMSIKRNVNQGDGYLIDGDLYNYIVVGK